MRKIKRNDEVIVISGKDKNKRGTVTRVLPNDRLIVSGVRILRNHQKPNPQMAIPGGFIDKEGPIAVSNVAIFNPETQKADRVGFRFEDGKKVRIFKSDGKIVPERK